VKRDNFTAVCGAAAVFALWATPAFAYLGPGAGLAAIGAFLALILGMIAAVFGFIWYPVKRLLRKKRAAGASPSQPQQEPEVAPADEDT
jgi:hypothetical protein